MRADYSRMTNVRRVDILRVNCLPVFCVNIHALYPNTTTGLASVLQSTAHIIAYCFNNIYLQKSRLGHQNMSSSSAINYNHSILKHLFEKKTKYTRRPSCTRDSGYKSKYGNYIRLSVMTYFLYADLLRPNV